MLGFCETVTCRRRVLLEYFGQDLPEPCGNCDVCLAPPETFDGTVAAQKLLSCAIRTGQRFGPNLQVTEGLKPGERIILYGIQKVRPGVTVKPELSEAPKDPMDNATSSRDKPKAF